MLNITILIEVNLVLNILKNPVYNKTFTNFGKTVRQGNQPQLVNLSRILFRDGNDNSFFPIDMAPSLQQMSYSKYAYSCYISTYANSLTSRGGIPLGPVAFDALILL